MRIIATALLAVAAVTVIGVSASKTMPLTPLAPLAEAVADATPVETTSGGCGFLGHRGPYGACRPLYSCPFGWHPGPFGQRCFRNY